MIIVAVKSKVKPEYKAEFLETTKALQKTVVTEEGCIAYTQHMAIEDDHTMFLFEQWETINHIKKHLASAHMQTFMHDSAEWFESKDIKIYEASEVSL